MPQVRRMGPFRPRVSDTSRRQRRFQKRASKGEGKGAKGGKGDAPERIGPEGKGGRVGKGEGGYQKMGKDGHRSMTFSAPKKPGR